MTSTLDETDIRKLADAAGDRMQLWSSFLNHCAAETAAEVGVFRGDYAARMLSEVDSLKRYYMVDPWRHLADWNKPANQPDDIFEQYFAETMAKTEAHADKRVVLRGRTVEVIDEIEDGSLDFAYIDGDHTLRGVTVDLARWYPKIKEGGFLGGDDFCRSIFQHNKSFEPTLVFPYAVYFAEAMGVRIFGLPYRQFVMQKIAADGATFVDLTGGYGDLTLQQQLARYERRTPRQQPGRRNAPGQGRAKSAGNAAPAWTKATETAQRAVRKAARSLRSR